MLDICFPIFNPHALVQPMTPKVEMRYDYVQQGSTQKVCVGLERALRGNESKTLIIDTKGEHNLQLTARRWAELPIAYRDTALTALGFEAGEIIDRDPQQDYFLLFSDPQLESARLLAGSQIINSYDPETDSINTNYGSVKLSKLKDFLLYFDNHASACFDNLVLHMLKSQPQTFEWTLGDRKTPEELVDLICMKLKTEPDILDIIISNCLEGYPLYIRHASEMYEAEPGTNETIHKATIMAKFTQECLRDQILFRGFDRMKSNLLRAGVDSDMLNDTELSKFDRADRATDWLIYESQSSSFWFELGRQAFEEIAYLEYQWLDARKLMGDNKQLPRFKDLSPGA